MNKVIQLSSDERTATEERTLIHQMNKVLVSILKQEWPHNWPSFIGDICGASRTSEILCENNMHILRLLSEEVFDFSKDAMTTSKIRTMKESLNAEFALIFRLCEFVLGASQRPRLIDATLATLRAFLSWIPLGYIFETPLVTTLVDRFFMAAQFRNAALECLTEIASLTDLEPKYEEASVRLYLSVLRALGVVVPRDASLAAAYDNAQSGNERDQLFVQRLALFFSGFFKAHLKLVESPEHAQALDLLHTGSFQFTRPSMGSWVLYGLGAMNQDLPGFVTINPPSVLGGSKYYGSAFLPAAYQGTPIGGDNKPLANVKVSNLENHRLNRKQQRQKLDALQALNRQLLEKRGQSSELEGVIESFELAFRMQNVLPEVMDISDESEATKKLYGMDRPASKNFGHQCLLARRMAEADVRFIQLTDDGWDHHGGLASGLPRRCASIDKPITGLLTDLRQRGLLEETLIIWGGEFGRTPDDGTRDGRGHNATGFTMFMAGAGVKHGFRYGATDEHGRRAVEGQISIHDLHATMLHLLGLDHEQLTYPWAGRDFRLTDVHGRVVHEILS
ncbi:MAG: DUF1501 domain-containing protein [Verrucomicrobiota bacterium]